MPKTYPELVAEARAKIGVATPEETAASGAVILDVREPAEVAKGRVAGDFIHIPRGLLEPKADAQTGDPALLAAKDGGAIHVLCAVGGRAALAAATLVDMGYDAKVIEGGFAGWKKAGLDVVEG